MQNGKEPPIACVGAFRGRHLRDLRRRYPRPQIGPHAVDYLLRGRDDQDTSLLPIPRCGGGKNRRQECGILTRQSENTGGIGRSVNHGRDVLRTIAVAGEGGVGVGQRGLAQLLHGNQRTIQIHPRTPIAKQARLFRGGVAGRDGHAHDIRADACAALSKLIDQAKHVLVAHHIRADQALDRTQAARVIASTAALNHQRIH